MIRLAFRNLFQSKARLLISTGGVALALLLILSLDAIFTGMERQVTAYIDHSGADIFVAQAGVRNMHMTTSSLPATAVAEVEGVAGVTTVTPILYLSNIVAAGADRHLAYVIGLPPGAAVGGAWQVSAGKSEPAGGETIIDRGIAEKSGVGLGDQVEILGQAFTIAGLSEGTASLLNSVAFISLADFAALRGGDPLRSSGVLRGGGPLRSSGPDPALASISFLLVKVAAGEAVTAVSTRIETAVNGVTALPTADFAAQERQVIRDMGTDILAIMNLVGFFIGLAVMALTVYTATLARRSEYGVLKALGAANRHLYATVLLQALISVALGFGLGLAFTLLLAAMVPRLNLNLALAVSAASLFKVAGLSLFIAGLAALLPVRQIAGLDPVMVFRGK
jgi:putative ABC transport system permease protein